MILSLDHLCLSFPLPIFGLNLPVAPRIAQCAFSRLACIFASTELGSFGVLGVSSCFLKDS